MTWKTLYNDFSKYIGDEKILIEGTSYVAEKYAWESAGWVWGICNNLNERFTESTTPSVENITLSINGGLNGLNDRVKAYDTIREVIK